MKIRIPNFDESKNRKKDMVYLSGTETETGHIKVTNVDDQPIILSYFPNSKGEILNVVFKILMNRVDNQGVIIPYSYMDDYDFLNAWLSGNFFYEVKSDKVSQGNINSTLVLLRVLVVLSIVDRALRRTLFEGYNNRILEIVKHKIFSNTSSMNEQIAAKHEKKTKELLRKRGNLITEIKKLIHRLINGDRRANYDSDTNENQKDTFKFSDTSIRSRSKIYL